MVTRQRAHIDQLAIMFINIRENVSLLLSVYVSPSVSLVERNHGSHLFPCTGLVAIDPSSSHGPRKLYSAQHRSACHRIKQRAVKVKSSCDSHPHLSLFLQARGLVDPRQRRSTFGDHQSVGTGRRKLKTEMER